MLFIKINDNKSQSTGLLLVLTPGQSSRPKQSFGTPKQRLKVFLKLIKKGLVIFQALFEIYLISKQFTKFIGILFEI